MDSAAIKKKLREGWREYRLRSLRWSYLIIGGMALLGLLANLLLPHGWTAWPFVLAAGLLLMMHEAADRNGHGVPPLQVYALFVSAIGLWLVIVIVIRAVNPIVLLLCMLGLGYYGATGYLKQVERVRLMSKRRAEGLCIHCGHPVDPQMAYCEHCGEEPDPETARIQRVLNVSRSSADKARTRAALSQKPAPSTAALKEQALLAKKNRGRK